MSRALFQKQIKDQYGNTVLSRMKNDWSDYEFAYKELSDNYTKPVSPTAFNDRVGGRYKFSRIAYGILQNQNVHIDQQTVEKPVWFEKYVASIAQSTSDSWKLISEHIAQAIREKVDVADALRAQAEKELDEHIEYVDQLSERAESERSRADALEVKANESMALELKVNSLLEQLSESKKELNVREEKLNRAQEKLDEYTTEILRLGKIEAQHGVLSVEHETLQQRYTELVSKAQLAVGDSEIDELLGSVNLHAIPSSTEGEHDE